MVMPPRCSSTGTASSACSNPADLRAGPQCSKARANVKAEDVHTYMSASSMYARMHIACILQTCMHMYICMCICTCTCTSCFRPRVGNLDKYLGAQHNYKVLHDFGDNPIGRPIHRGRQVLRGLSADLEHSS